MTKNNESKIKLEENNTNNLDVIEQAISNKPKSIVTTIISIKEGIGKEINPLQNSNLEETRLKKEELNFLLKEIGLNAKTVREEKDITHLKISQELYLKEEYIKLFEKGEMDELNEKSYYYGYFQNIYSYLGIPFKIEMEHLRKLLSEDIKIDIVNSKENMSYLLVQKYLHKFLTNKKFMILVLIGLLGSIIGVQFLIGVYYKKSLENMIIQSE
jgi:hypothetical protein